VSLQQACYADGALCSAAAMPQHSTQACVERRQLDSHVDCRVDETCQACDISRALGTKVHIPLFANSRENQVRDLHH